MVLTPHRDYYSDDVTMISNSLAFKPFYHTANPLAMEKKKWFAYY